MPFIVSCLVSSVSQYSRKNSLLNLFFCCLDYLELQLAAGGSGARAEQSRSVIEEADEDTQRRDDEEVLRQQPWHRGIIQAAGVPANGAGSQTASGVPNLFGTCRTLHLQTTKGTTPNTGFIQVTSGLNSATCPWDFRA